MDSKKKRKNYFSNQGNDSKRRKGLALDCGMRGFLCTCNYREKDCIREAYNLLNEYADKISEKEENQIETIDNDKKEIEEPKTNAEEEKLEGDNNIKEENEKVKEDDKEISLEKDDKEISLEKDNKEILLEKDDKEISLEKDDKEISLEKDDKVILLKKDEKESENQQIELAKCKEQEDINNDSDDEDISTALNKELNELKAEAAKPLSQKKFQVVDTGVSNVIFIKTTISDPLQLTIEIIKDLDKTKKQKSRHLLRMLPIQVVCKPYLDDIKSKADVLFEKYFAQEPKTFCIVFNRHSNSNLQRSEVIVDLAQIISKKNPGNKANLKNPDIAVVVEVIRAVCLLSIAPNYFTYKKYNLLEICKK